MNNNNKKKNKIAALVLSGLLVGTAVTAPIVADYLKNKPVDINPNESKQNANEQEDNFPYELTLDQNYDNTMDSLAPHLCNIANEFDNGTRKPVVKQNGVKRISYAILYFDPEREMIVCENRENLDDIKAEIIGFKDNAVSSLIAECPQLDNYDQEALVKIVEAIKKHLTAEKIIGVENVDFIAAPHRIISTEPYFNFSISDNLEIYNEKGITYYDYHVVNITLKPYDTKINHWFENALTEIESIYVTSEKPLSNQELYEIIYNGKSADVSISREKTESNSSLDDYLIYRDFELSSDY